MSAKSEVLLGLASYFRGSIKDFSIITIPLTSLTKKDKKFTEGEGCEKSFQTHNGMFGKYPNSYFASRFERVCHLYLMLVTKVIE